jgi:uncharacterized LabA/DUF88 family protein
MPDRDLAIFFVDGANFYKHLKRSDVRANAVDIDKVADKLAGPRKVVQIRYYLPELDRSAGPAFIANRDQLADLRKRPRVQVCLGYMQKDMEENPFATEVIEYLKNAPMGTPGLLLVELTKRAIACQKVTTYKEKGVDVALACDMVELALENKYDVAYLISADGDFFPAVNMVQARDKRVFAAGPAIGKRLQDTCAQSIRTSRDWYSDCTIAKR